MTKQEWNELKLHNHVLGRELAYEIMEPIREQDDAPILAVAIAYILFKSFEEGFDISSPEAFVNSFTGISDDEKRRKKAFYEGRMGRIWDVVLETPKRLRVLSNGISRNAIALLKSVVLFFDYTRLAGQSKDYTSMPESIAKLAMKLLDIQEGDRVGEYCTGRGTFTVLASLEIPNLSLLGLELDSLLCEITSMRIDAAGGRMDLIEGDVFNWYNRVVKRTKVFSNYPFGQRRVEIAPDVALEGSLLRTVSDSSIKFADWQFIASAVETLDEGGKAVVVTSGGSLLNRYDRAARQLFVERGYIEAVIALPDRLFNNLSIPVTLLVIKKKKPGENDSDSIRFVDASGLCASGRFTNVIEDEHIDQIMTAVKENTGYGRDVSVEEIEQKDWVLAADRYLSRKVDIHNSQDFGEYIKSIKRGVFIKADELKSMETDEEGCDYLQISNIVDGYIDHAGLKHIKPNDKLASKLANYRIKNGDLLITKSGAPFKISVADVQDNQTLIANDNMFVIEIDEEKGNPYFFRAFFESEKGRRLLNSAAVGSVIKMISAEAVRKLPVPDVPLYEQQKIANELKEITNDLRERTARYNRTAARLRQKASHVCEEWNEESSPNR